jgi:hypothetical protein
MSGSPCSTWIVNSLPVEHDLAALSFDALPNGCFRSGASIPAMPDLDRSASREGFYALDCPLDCRPFAHEWVKAP